MLFSGKWRHLSAPLPASTSVNMGTLSAPWSSLLMGASWQALAWPSRCKQPPDCFLAEKDMHAEVSCDMFYACDSEQSLSSIAGCQAELIAPGRQRSLQAFCSKCQALSKAHIGAVSWV